MFFKTFGCRVNQIETESLREKIIAFGNSETKDVAEADSVVVNTCSVTSKADRDCLAFIRKTSAANPQCSIFVSGCFAELSADKIKAVCPEARIFKNSEKEKIASSVCNTVCREDFSSVSGFYGRSRAFVKVQDGCNLKCSYCLVNMARSEIKSKPLGNALSEIKNLINNGFKEIVLCGTRLGYYHCPQTKASLADLMSELFALDGDFRIRFSSVEITELNPKLIDILAKAGDKFCNYFHLPLQSGSDKVLKDMNRPYNTSQYEQTVNNLRKIFPNVGIYADIIVGYPTETDEDFNIADDFVKKVNMSGLHIFSFSARKGTPAAALKPLQPSIITSRSEQLHKTDAVLRENFALSQKGKTLQTLVLSNKKGISRGLSSNFLNINFGTQAKNGTLHKVLIEKNDKDILFGDITN